ncbi:MAG TPA: 3-dehydroquinate synthase [Pirellulales bacterium]|nr:3-dehydroquinate synthase [Pirellulales bacterium]
MTDPSQNVRVELGDRSYDIEIGRGNLARTGEFIAARTKITHGIIITDARVEQLHAETVRASLLRGGARVDLIAVPEGERSKSMERATTLWNQLLDLGADRRSVVVAVGGGVVGDLAGFIAATFTRGIPFFQIPTTLLAQVDSSVGGKVGVNLPRAKNMVGAFWQPLGVLIDTEVLKSMTERDYRAGLAEVVKYGVILDAEFFAFLEANVAGLLGRRHDVLRRVIARSCELKAQVVAGDERDESGLRAVLNYGHTFAHAIESESRYDTHLHGEAVSIGMMCAAHLAERLGRVSPLFTQRQQRLLEALGLPIVPLDVKADALLAAMLHDKKVEHGQLRFVLPTRLGHVELVGNIDPGDVKAALSAQ